MELLVRESSSVQVKRGTFLNGRIAIITTEAVESKLQLLVFFRVSEMQQQEICSLFEWSRSKRRCPVFENHTSCS